MTTLLNYADHNFRTSQKKNSRTGLSVGGFDQVLSYGPQDVDRIFYGKNKGILDNPKGNGLWLWKPYFIVRTLQNMQQGDWLFYCDSGSYFIHSIQPLVDLAEGTGSHLIIFADEHQERNYTKRDTFISLNADIPSITDSLQMLGGFSLWSSSSAALNFATEWLNYAQVPRIISDAENELGYPNYAEFKGHRHDQSIFSIMAKQKGLPAYRDPSQWGNDRIPAYPNSPYPQLIELTRMRDLPWKRRIKDALKSLLRLK